MGMGTGTSVVIGQGGRRGGARRAGGSFSNIRCHALNLFLKDFQKDGGVSRAFYAALGDPSCFFDEWCTPWVLF